jgi:glycosyltransferase involved in cell wall biosynthesis
MRIAYITAGAAGMFCGSCMHDNTLVSTLIAAGHDAVLIPTYTPIRTDEKDVSLPRVFFGGINVFLQQKLGLFRHTPWFVDRALDLRPLLRWAGRFAVKTDASKLGDLTVSTLLGERGNQHKEVRKLADWLAEDFHPEIVNLTNVLLSGLAREIKRRAKVPVVATLQGDDIFLEALPPADRQRCLDLIRTNCAEIDGFIATSEYYANFMAEYLGLSRDKIHIVYPGLDLTGHASPDASLRARGIGPPVVGYFARICPEKGLHHLVDAFTSLRTNHGTLATLHASGWLGENQTSYLEGLRLRLAEHGVDQDFHHMPTPDHARKVAFLQSLDVMSVPTTYREPKGLYVLEALANGVPVVQPRHGSFPELIERTGGGLLVNPDDPEDLAQSLASLLKDEDQRRELGQKGRKAVHEFFNAARMAEETLVVYRKYR